MGHSTVSFTVKGKLNYSEIKEKFNQKCSEDRSEYGYNESPDSFAHARTPSSSRLGSVYSPLKSDALFDNCHDYDSFCHYSISYKVFKEIYKKDFKKIDKIKDKIAVLNDKVIKASNENLQKLGLKDSTKVSGKTIFFTTPCCNSKINVNAYSSRGYNTPTRCPICGTHKIEGKENQFENVWREKVLGKSYAKTKEKISAQIKKLQDEIKQFENSIPEVIDESKLTKAQKEEIITIVYADIHH